jgi:hypothetical protein
VARALSLALLVALSVAGRPALAEAPPIDAPATLMDTLVLMRDRLAVLYPEAVVEIDAGDLRLLVRGENGRQSVMHPDNITARLRTIDDPALRGAELDHFLKSLISAVNAAEGTAAIDPDRLFAVLRPDSLGRAAEGAQRPATIEVVGEVALYFVIDEEASVQYVTSEMAAESDLDLAAVAEANLDRKMGDLQWEGDGDIRLALLDGFFESSLVTSARFRAAAAEWAQDPVYAFPARDLMLVVDSASDGAVDRARAFIADIYPQLADTLTPELYVWQDGQLQLHAP